MNLAVALRTADELGRRNMPPVLTRTRDASVSLKARVKTANEAGAAVFVSVHCNSAADGAAHGTEAFHLAGSESGEKLAAAICRSVQAATGLFNRGTKPGDFYVLRHTSMPAALIELAFISNEDEERLLRDAAFRERAARAIAEGVEAYLRAGAAETP